ncbi:MAG: DUF3147 family protein [Acidimicrobiales bacterium]
MASEPLFALDLSQLRDAKLRDLGIRFAFGAAISVIAGLGGILLGTAVGGLLLAFPAILPATLTLIESEDSKAAAVHDVGGAVLGGVGLVAFAAVAAATFGRLPAWTVLAAALVAWTVVSLALYVLRATERVPLPPSIRGRTPPDNHR